MRIKRYDIQLTVFPATGEIRSEALCTCVATSKAESIEFLLHRDLKISRLEGDGIATWSIENTCSFPFTPEAATVTVRLDHAVREGENLDFTVAYSGAQARVPQAWGLNCVSTDWVELGLYGPWFPWQPCTGPVFTYTVETSVPPGYELIGLGDVAQVDGKWRLTSARPVSDIVLVGAPDLCAASAANREVRADVHFPGAAGSGVKGLASNIAGEVVWILQYFRSWLKDESCETASASVIISPRATGGGYARPGLIVLADIESLSSRPSAIFKYAAHEFAHLWWAGAPTDTWEDWLNEGFAEYSAIRAVKARLGEEAAGDLVQKKRERVQGLPPLRGIDRASEQAHPVLYDKGSLLLLDLEEEVGSAVFDAIVLEFCRSEQRDTRGLLKILERHAGERTAQEFDRRLDN